MEERGIWALSYAGPLLGTVEEVVETADRAAAAAALLRRTRRSASPAVSGQGQGEGNANGRVCSGRGADLMLASRIMCSASVVADLCPARKTLTQTVLCAAPSAAAARM